MIIKLKSTKKKISGTNQKKKTKNMDLKKENLPNNFLAEQGILNILLTNPSLIKNISNLIKPESFYYEEHEIIYSLMLELTDNEGNKSTNLTIIITELQNRGYCEN